MESDRDTFIVFELSLQVKKFMVGFEMLGQVQRDLTAEQVGVACEVT